MSARPTRAILVGALAVPLVLALAGPAAAAGLGAEDQVVLTGSVDVPEGATVGNVVILNGPATVEGTVRGDLFALNGDVRISGTVTKNVTVVNGRVVIGGSARIGGDLATGNAPAVLPGAVVAGDRRRVNVGFVFGQAAVVGAILGWIAVAVSTLALGMLFLAVAPRAGEAVGDTARAKVWASIGWGFAAFFGIPIFAGLAIATLVGIPLGIGILLSLVLVYAFSATASAFALGRLLLPRPRSRFLAYLSGWAILAGVSIVPFLGGIVWFASMVFGIGAVTVAVWSARRPPATVAPGTALPPPPSA
jgi:hypothetical protein